MGSAAGSANDDVGDFIEQPQGVETAYPITTAGNGIDMTNHKPDLAERIGRAINELDIDFSRLSFVGWVVSFISLGAGGGLAYLISNAMVQRDGMGTGVGLVFCFTIIGVATGTFLVLRWIVNRCGISVIRKN